MRLAVRSALFVGLSFLALPALAQDGCSGEPEPQCLLAEARIAAADIADPDYRAAIDGLLDQIGAEPTILHTDLLDLYIDPNEYLDGRLGTPEEAPAAARALEHPADQALALIGLGRHLDQPDLIIEAVDLVSSGAPDIFTPQEKASFLFTALAEMQRSQGREAARDLALNRADPVERTSLLTYLAALLSPM